MNKYDSKVNEIVYEVSRQAAESNDEFIIDTIMPYCSEVTKIRISKEKLKEALVRYYNRHAKWVMNPLTFVSRCSNCNAIKDSAYDSFCPNCWFAMDIKGELDE